MSTGFEDERIAIEKRFNDNWTTTPIVWSNVPFKEQTTPYVALFILDGEGEQVSLGTVAMRRWAGVVVIQVFTLPDTGTKLARTYAETIAAIFDRAQFSYGGSGTITCRVPSIDPVGVENGWYQVNVNVPFIRDKQY
jgi:hypothetical protein